MVLVLTDVTSILLFKGGFERFFFEKNSQMRKFPCSQTIVKAPLLRKQTKPQEGEFFFTRFLSQKKTTPSSTTKASGALKIL